MKVAQAKSNAPLETVARAAISPWDATGAGASPEVAVAD